MTAARTLQVGAALLGLVLVYALTLGSFKPLDLMLGAFAGSLVLIAFRGFVLPPPMSGAGVLARRALRLPAFLAVIAREVVVGTWRVGKAVLSSEPVGTSGLVIVPMGERTNLGVAVSSIAISLTPGELVVELDWDRRVMIVHALDARDPERLRAEQRQIYDRYQRGVFP